MKKFEDWGFCAITYTPVFQRWACLFPRNYKYIGGRSYPYSEDDPPILFVSGVVDGILDEYLYKEEINKAAETTKKVKENLDKQKLRKMKTGYDNDPPMYSIFRYDDVEF